MPAFDTERLAVAEGVRRALAIENALSSAQASAFVRCLQTTWQVPTIQWSAQDTARQMADARRLIQAAHIFRQIEGPSSTRAVDCYRRTGEILEWLSRADDDIRSVLPIELLAAGAYQLGGLPAMATGLLAQVPTELDGVGLYADFLRADFDGVLRRAATFWSSHPELTVRGADRLLATEMLDPDVLEQDDGRVGWYFLVELVRSLGLIADSLRRGDDARLVPAIKKLHALDAMAGRTFSDDAALTLSLIRQVADSFLSSTIFKPLRALAGFKPDRTDRLLAYARQQFSRGRGILWTSQTQGLDRLLAETSFALCTPTGSGKTLVANLALIRELLLRDHDGLAPLALYIVPSRALAGEVEAKLRAELGRDLVITGLYGGADWGITDAWLTGDAPTVLIATVEKAEALMRYLGTLLLARLRLMIIDEAHQVVVEANETTQVSFAEHGSRALRLEALVSRVLAQKPDVVRIALTAVAGGASGPVARWIEGRSDAQPVGGNYRSTRQVIGVLETAPGTTGRILLDIMNGRTLYVRGREEPVYLPLRMAPMPQLPAEMRNSLNRFNCLSVLWTALHLVEEDQRVLISVAQEPEQTMGWFRDALLLPGWSDVSRFDAPTTGASKERFDEARAACLDYCGETSFELFLLERGIATSHGQMPQRLRRLMVEMIDKRICPITVATATLTEGVNLPFDLIFLTSLKRRSWDAVAEQAVVAPMSTAEFRNLAGRAGRPGAARGVEGLTLVALPSAISTTADGSRLTQRNQMRDLAQDYERLRASLLIEETDADVSSSPLSVLLNAIWTRANRVLGVTPEAFWSWLETTAPGAITPGAGTGATDGVSRVADMLDELDGVLLNAIEEVARADEIDMTRARAEEHLVDLWRRTFSAVTVTEETWLEQAFVKRGGAIVETLYTDPAERRRLYHYGFSPLVGRRFEAIAPAIRLLIAEASDYGDLDARGRLGVFEAIGELLVGDRGFGFRARSTVGDRTLLEDWRAVLAWWMNEPDVAVPQAADLRAWQRFTTDNLEFRLGVAVGAVVAHAWSEGADDPLAVPSLAEWKGVTGLPWFGFWARELLRWGTHDPFVAFALAQGLAHTREAATARRPAFLIWLEGEVDTPDSEALIDPQLFLRWQASLPRLAGTEGAQITVSATLTGSDGHRERYSVVPASRLGETHWIDPASFELAMSSDPLDQFGPETVGDDYELRVQSGETLVRRVFERA